MNALRYLTTFDLIAFNWCLDRPKASEIARLSRYVSHLGDGGFYLATGMVLALFEPVYGLTFLLVGLAAFAIELPLYLLLKNTIKRDRPCDAIEKFEAFIVPSDKFSFPSGHAAAAFLFVTLLVHFYPAYLLAGYCFAVLVGLSRVLLGVHYPSDIMAGALLGWSCAQLVLVLLLPLI